MADYLLDTNILSYWYDTSTPEHAKVVARAIAASQPDASTGYISRFYVSVITRGEIEYGHRVYLPSDFTKRKEYFEFVQEKCAEFLPITKHVAEQYGILKAWLFEKCSPRPKRSKAKRAEELVNPTTGRELGVDENDIWIAAHAWTHNLVLVTNDSRGHFGKVLEHFSQDLRVENWAS